MPTDVKKLVEAELTRLARSLRVELAGDGLPAAARPVVASIAAPPELRLVDLFEYALDLTLDLDPFVFASKDVQFSTFTPETPQTKTFQDLAAHIVRETPLFLPGGVTQITGTPGLLAQFAGLLTKLKGNVPITLPSLPVSADVTWTVLDDQKKPLAAATDFLAPEGLNAPQAVFVFPPRFLEESAAPDPMVYFLRPEVVLAAAGFASPKTVLPDLELRLPRLSLAQLARDTYAFEVPSNQAAVAAPFDVKLVETGADTVLTRLPEVFPKIQVKVSYALRRGTQAPAAGEVNGIPASGDLTPSALLRFFLIPRAEALSQAPPSLERWEFTASVAVSGVPGVAGAVTAALPPIPLLQQALPVPELFAGFAGRHYEAAAAARPAAYVFLAPGNPALDGVVLDANSDPALVLAAKDAVLTQLRTFRDVHRLLRGLFSALPDMNADAFAKVLSGIGKAAVFDLVVDGTFRCRDFGEHAPGQGIPGTGWNDAISSIAMFGPLGSRTFSLFQDAEWKGREVPFAVPAGNFIATFWTIHESWATDSVKAGPYEGPPGPNQPPVTPPFGNEATSSTWK